MPCVNVLRVDVGRGKIMVCNDIVGQSGMFSQFSQTLNAFIF